jgi:hypothetical protein
MTKLAVQTLPDLTDATKTVVTRRLVSAGFEPHRITRGGYAEFRHPDGSAIWIRPSGEVIRLGPRVASASGKKYRRRYDQYGHVTSLHSTGEVVSLQDR